MIELKGVDKVYRTKSIETTALNNINLKINKGAFVSIMGPSGCGKSTLLNMIGLLDEPTHGAIEIDGKQITSAYRIHFSKLSFGIRPSGVGQCGAPAFI